ncbi:hypothetical protein QCN29_06110 [Streptomyces sp. HNM0663]|uniref:DUF732 domain-containing protein n=1 Tax=Streptomyces chengmaiensis TaxID=3040919 RepID=A0ABT6HJ48_9ACTN|nr:hypothetical protein [Streptomyces chengmaiensis]MDH2388366.1 hypothetical protein [Streptomyces chengmaiensis]
MRRTHLRRPAAASLLLAAVLAVTGCSSSEKDEAKAAASASASERSAAERVEDQVDQDGGDGKTESPSPSESADSGPVRPDSELKPATGSFTKDEKEYLKGRVPQSIEPAAVLDVGKEACQRIERTAKRDKDATVAAVIAGEIKDAEDAVNHLCPEQKPVLDAAKGGYADGTHANPAAGRYRTLTAGPGCTWSVMDAKGGEVASGPGPEGGDQHELTIPSGAKEFTSNGCYAWARVTG